MTLKSPAMTIGLFVLQQRLDALLQPRHPGELVDVFLGAERVAVRQIDIDQAERAGGHRDHRLEIARLHVVRVAGEPRRDLVEGELGEQRHAVEALLPVHRDVIAERLELEAGEGLVDAFDLLQAGDVGRGGFEPGRGRLDARLDAVDVPGGDLHGISILQPHRTSSCPALCRASTFLRLWRQRRGWPGQARP